MSCNLENIQDVRDWLSRRENQISSEIFIVKWTGADPAIAVQRLKDLTENDELASVILSEHKRRKRRPDVEREEEVSDE